MKVSFEEAETWANKEFQKHGYPSLYASSDNVEAFAEFFASLALDPEAQSYVKAPLREWFDQNVFEKQSTARLCRVREG